MLCTENCMGCGLMIGRAGVFSSAELCAVCGTGGAAFAGGGSIPGTDGWPGGSVVPEPAKGHRIGAPAEGLLLNDPEPQELKKLALARAVDHSR